MEYHSGGSLPLLGRPRYCPGANANGGYLCETGHCCGETGCCTYYYELWWFWLLWTVLILFSCCCAYRHRRAKLQVQQQQRQREISLLAYHGAGSFPSSMLDLSFLASLKLPSYEEVAAQPSTPPPPYSSVFTTPRYPQPPRAADPHLLTQHGPLLHRPLSDGPSSLSSDNSSSCSCDSCCPSSPCSSSLSPPITYETDTSHASTPSEATPLTLDVTMETIAATACCLEADERHFVSSERPVVPVAIEIEDTEADRAQEPNAKESSLSSQTVTMVVVTRATSPQQVSSPGSELTPPIAATSPLNLQLDTASGSPVISTGGSSLPSPSVNTIISPTIQTTRTKSVSEPQTPTASGSCLIVKPPETLSLMQTFDPARVPCGPTSVPPLDIHRTMAFKTSSTSLQTPDPHLNFVPIVSPITPTQTPVSKSLTQDQDPSLLDPVLPNDIPVSNPQSTTNSIPTPKPTYLNLTQDTDAVPGPSPLTQNLNLEQLPRSGLVWIPHSPGSGASQDTTLVSCLDLISSADNSGPALVSDELSQSNLVPPLPSDVQAGFSSGSGSLSRSSPLSTRTLVLTCPAPEDPPSSCPAITIESETFTTSRSSVSVLCPSSPQSPPPFAAPALLLDPVTALQQSDKGGSSSGHASSLSPSPRATQSPPKQTGFSPCVDIFEPGPPCKEDGEDEQDDGDKDEEDDDDVGADESQYRHRRLTGDSGIEVCRCRVEEEEEEDEEEEQEEGRRGGGANAGVHDSVDCPVRGQMSTGDELSLCVNTPTPDDSKVVIVMETV